MFEILFSIILAVIGVCIVAFMIYDRIRKNRLRDLMNRRLPLNDSAFSARWFSESPQLSDTAVRLRKILQENIEQPLDSLNPDDRLEDDLYLELPRNPDLFWAIEQEFDIKTSILDYAVHENDLKSLNTFRDLIGYVEAKRSEVETK